MTANNSVELFWSTVDKGDDDDCWIWKGYRDRKGYGRTFWDGKKRRTHRIAYVLSRGAIPADLNVLHRCDNPSCCNPKHLFLGTQLDNNVDKKVKGRSYRPIAERNPKAKLTWPKVREIRQLHLEGALQVELARLYGVSTMTICAIVNHKQWKESQ